MVASKYRYFNGKQYTYHDKAEGKGYAEEIKAIMKKRGYLVRLTSPGNVVKHDAHGVLKRTNVPMYLIYVRKK